MLLILLGLVFGLVGLYLAVQNPAYLAITVFHLTSNPFYFHTVLVISFALGILISGLKKERPLNFKSLIEPLF